MQTKLYIGNISYQATAADLGQLFETIGPIASATIASNKGKSLGFGFVVFEEETFAKAAVQKFHNSVFFDRTIKVEIAQDKPYTKQNLQPQSKSHSKSQSQAPTSQPTSCLYPHLQRFPIEIMNMHNTFPSRSYDVRVDRATILGNPFKLVPGSGATRDSVCDQYAAYFKEQMNKKGTTDFKTEVNRIIELYKQYNKLRLFCWCAPLRCHSETIREYVNENVDKENGSGEKRENSSHYSLYRSILPGFSAVDKEISE